MAEDIKALDYSFEEVGKHLKSSKKRYIWKFLLSQATHNVVCDTSVVSNKVKIQLNGKVVKETDVWAGQGFQHKFSVDGHECIIIQEGDRFELRIDNKIFLHLLNQEKAKKEFKNHQECVEDISLTQNLGWNKEEKMSLNISAIEGMKKKKNNVMESENWKGMQTGAEKDIEYFKRNAALGQPTPIHSSQLPPSSVNVYVPPSQIKSSQQFNTMQMLFNTQNQGPAAQKVQTSIIGGKEENNAVQMMEEFNTMQKLFATNMQKCMGISPQTPQNGEFSTIQQLCTAQSPDNMSEKKQSSENNFSTIQQLFATQAPTHANSNNEKPQTQTSPPFPTDFNTMQNLFKSINPNGQAHQDLSAMSQLFSTITPPGGKKEQPNQNNPVSQPSPQEFSTLQNLFATQQMGIPNIQQINTSMMKAEDFSTMQNLFATMKIDPSIVQNEKNSTPLADSTNVKAEDFNTMQSLFKTRMEVPSPENQQNQ